MHNAFVFGVLLRASDLLIALTFVNELRKGSVYLTLLMLAYMITKGSLKVKKFHVYIKNTLCPALDITLSPLSHPG